MAADRPSQSDASTADPSGIIEQVRRILIAGIIAVAIIVGIVLYRTWHSANNLQVDPHAREEIEKAKHR